MSSAKRDRTIAAAPQRVWDLISDPHQFPNWWPGVTRVEGVSDDAWTQVFTTKKGRAVRIDFRLLESDPPWNRAWEQEIPGTPFERVLIQSITELTLEPVDGGTRVTLAQHQKLKGYSKTGGMLLKRATKAKLSEALDGLERACAE